MGEAINATRGAVGIEMVAGVWNAVHSCDGWIGNSNKHFVVYYGQIPGNN